MIDFIQLPTPSYRTSPPVIQNFSPIGPQQLSDASVNDILHFASIQIKFLPMHGLAPAYCLLQKHVKPQKTNNAKNAIWWGLSWSLPLFPVMGEYNQSYSGSPMHLLSSDDNAVAQSDAHGGELRPGLLWETGGSVGHWHKGQGVTGPGQSVSQQCPELLGYGGSVRHLQGHVQGIWHHVRWALPFLILEKKNNNNNNNRWAVI